MKRRESLRAKVKRLFRVRTMADYRKDGADAAVMMRDADSRDVFFAVVSESERRAASRCAAMRRVPIVGCKRKRGAVCVSQNRRNFDETEERASLAALLNETAHACSGVPWARAWTERIVSETACAVCSSRLRERSAAGDLEDVCAALKAYAAQDFRGLRRVLSTAAYGDSKYFEKAVSASFVKAAELGGFVSVPLLIWRTSWPLWVSSRKHRCVAIAEMRLCVHRGG
ncbi:MAG: hypothetical protein ACLTQI_01440 [Slackia sp.]